MEELNLTPVEEEVIELAPVVEEVVALLGDVVYGVDAVSLENVCVKLLKEKGWTMATAESCTGGLIAKRIPDLPGASAVLRPAPMDCTNRVPEHHRTGNW